MRNSIANYLLLFFVLSFQFACSMNGNEEETIPETDKKYVKSTIEYKKVEGVDPNLLSLDIYHFEGSTTLVPVIIYVHGGAWSVGDKANSLENKIALFDSLGYTFVSINYRLSPTTADFDENRIKYPVHNQDVADAIKWIFDTIENYGGNKQKIVIMGHSAGGHLVSLTGTSQKFLSTKGLSLNSLKGVVSIDTEGYSIADEALEGNNVYINAFGNDPIVWKEASPNENIISNVAYPSFFVAKRGSAKRLARANFFINKLTSVGTKVVQLEANQYDHEGINAAIGAKNETVITPVLIAFFTSCFE